MAASPDPCDAGRPGRPLLELVEARRLLLETAAPGARPTVSVPLSEALGRTSAAPVCLDRAEPPVARSAMDGFAIRSADGAAPRRLVGSVFAGTAGIARIEPGEAIAVMTGGTIAAGADAVVPVEWTRVEGETLRLDQAVPAGRHVRAAGEIGAAGAEVIPAGARLGIPELAAAASCGADPLLVAGAPRATVLSTGDEVVAWTETPADHQVRDANRLATALQLRDAGAEVLATRRIPDDPAALRAAVDAACDAGELVVTIGGVSMGEKDHLPQVFTALGIECLFHGVAVQPGKPVWVGRGDRAWVLGLPGNPVSSFVVAELFLRPLLARLLGRPVQAELPLQACTVDQALAARGRERFFPARLRAQLDGPPRAEALVGRGSGDWTVLARAEVLIRLAAGRAVDAGGSAHYLPIGGRD